MCGFPSVTMFCFLSEVPVTNWVAQQLQYLAQRPLEHVNNDLQSIMTEGMLHPVVQCTNRAVSKTLVVSLSKLQTQFAWRVHPSKYSLPLRYDGQSQSCLFHHSSTTCSRARGKRDMLYMNSYLSQRKENRERLLSQGEGVQIDVCNLIMLQMSRARDINMVNTQKGKWA